MKSIKLTNSSKLVLVDDEDYEYLNKFKWSIQVGGHAQSRIFGKKVLIHRVIMGIDSEKDVDHINLNKLDNRRKNLRMCSRSQNKANANKPSNNTSGYKGVTWDKEKRKWKSKIKVNQINIHIGYFQNVLDGAIAYNKKALEYFGEFARINIIDGNSSIGNKSKK